MSDMARIARVLFADGLPTSEIADILEMRSNAAQAQIRQATISGSYGYIAGTLSNTFLTRAKGSVFSTNEVVKVALNAGSSNRCSAYTAAHQFLNKAIRAGKIIRLRQGRYQVK